MWLSLNALYVTVYEILRDYLLRFIYFGEDGVLTCKTFRSLVTAFFPAYPSRASVPVTVLVFDSPLLRTFL